MRNRGRNWLAIGLVVGAFPTTTRAAEEPAQVVPEGAVVRASSPGSGFLSGARTFARTWGVGLELDGRVRFESGLQLGAFVEGALLEEGFLSGLAVGGTATVGGGLLLVVPVLSSGPLELFVRFAPGFESLAARETGATALRQTNEIGALGHLALGERGLLRLGVLLGVELEVDPLFELADQSQLLTVGYGHALSENWLLYADARAGGTFGFDGDNGKAIVEGSLGVRLPFSVGGARAAF